MGDMVADDEFGREFDRRLAALDPEGNPGDEYDIIPDTLHWDDGRVTVELYVRNFTQDRTVALYEGKQHELFPQLLSDLTHGPNSQTPF